MAGLPSPSTSVAQLEATVEMISHERRRLVLGLFGFAVVATTPYWLVRQAQADVNPAAVQASVPNHFMALSALLTARPQLNAVLGQRIYQALSAADHGFARAADALWQHAQSNHLADATQLQASVASDVTLSATLTAIVSAWYLGSVTHGKETTLLAYEMALGNTLVVDTVATPSYCRAAPNYWRLNPAADAAPNNSTVAA